MIYISIDVETTGLDRENDQVLEFGAIIEDTTKQLSFEEIPKFSAILQHDRISGSAYALNMNARLIEILAKIPSSNFSKKYIEKHNIMRPSDLGMNFSSFLKEYLYPEYDHTVKMYNSMVVEKIIPAGKNFDSFDKQFLNKLPNFSKFIEFNRRTIDPTEFFIDFQNDSEPPSLNVCLERAGFTKNKVTHNALLDAWDVIKILRTQYSRNSINKEVALNAK